MVIMSYNQHPIFDFPEEIDLNPYDAKLTLRVDGIGVADRDRLGLDGGCAWHYSFGGDIEGHHYVVDIYVLRTIKEMIGIINGETVFTDKYNKLNELDDTVEIHAMFYDVVREVRRQLRCMVDEQKERGRE